MDRPMNMGGVSIQNAGLLKFNTVDSKTQQHKNMGRCTNNYGEFIAIECLMKTITHRGIHQL